MRLRFLYYVPTILAGIFTVFFWYTADATVYLSQVRNLLSTSAPSIGADQTITFLLAQAVPASGAIEIDFSGGGFVVPASGFDYRDVDLAIRATSANPFVDRALSLNRTVATDGVTVTTGQNGKVRINLNTSVGIPAGYEVQIELGLHAMYQIDGNTRISLGSATGSYPVRIRTYNASNAEIDYGATRVVIISPVGVGPADTTDQDPPIILQAIPTGILQSGTMAIEAYIETNEGAQCRYATSSVVYELMPFSFIGTVGDFGFYYNHYVVVRNLEDANTYTLYVRCLDYRANVIDPPYELEFTIGVPPGSASTTSTSTGTSVGSGSSSSTATSSTGTSDMGGTDTGTGTGGSGSGSGSSASGGDSSGSGSGGSGSGDGEGTQLPQASVRIDGFAYPGSVVTFIRDGTVIATKQAGGDGTYSNLTEGLDRGSYTFAVYATDSRDVRGATFSTTLWLQSDTLSTLTNIMLPPTVSVAENSIPPGTPIAVSGYSAPNALVTAWLRPKLAQVSASDVVATTTASGNGLWALTIPTASLPQGTYELLAQSWMADGAIQSDKSARKTIGIGVTVSDDDCKGIGDLNCDGFVNLVDFSILLFNWNTNSEVADINADGTVSLPDFSIMLYNWTG